MTLAEDMLTAAATIEALNEYLNYGDRVPWSSKELRREAPHVEAEECEKAAKEALVEDLAASMYEAMWGRPFDDCLDQERYRHTARALIESGWRWEPSE